MGGCKYLRVGLASACAGIGSTSTGGALRTLRPLPAAVEAAEAADWRCGGAFVTTGIS
jgi:hypothetical protein